MKTKLTNLLDRDDVIGLLRSEVAKAGSQSKWAKEKGVSRVVVCRILGGNENVRDKIVDALELEKIEFYRKRKNQPKSDKSAKKS
jgi:hypothetical protein